MATKFKAQQVLVPDKPQSTFDTFMATSGKKFYARLLFLAGLIPLYYFYKISQSAFNVSNYISAVSGSPNNVGDLTNETSWDWAALEPSRELKWHKCYNGVFTCARLDVPLDWLDPTEEHRVIIAVIRLEAKNKEDYRGPVFVNPGGPGGSGVSFARDSGKDLQAIVGDNHDIISFDPRGIGASVPRIECWGSSQRRNDWDLIDINVLDAYPGLVYEAFAQNEAYSKHCENYMQKQTSNLLRHLSTASHARDMLEISEKAGYSKLKYWGFSYGTILGGTFAAMFPERVERLVNDGNVDYHDWYSLEQLSFLEDTDKIMEAFFKSCFRAGPEKCAFYTEQGADGIKSRFLGLLATLRRSPVLIPAYANTTGPFIPELVTYSQLQLLVRTCLYKPIYKFPALARVMAALENRDGLPFFNLKNEGSDPVTMDSCMVNSTPPSIPTDAYIGNDAFPAIMCSDGEPFMDTPEAFADYAKALQEMSKYAGASNSHFRLSCVGRKIRPKYRHPQTENGANTSFPILFIGNIADNVTPLVSARNNSARFPASVVLVQKSYGHCTLAAPSTCSALVINSYFQNGTLPEIDTYCDQDYELFEDPPTRKVLGAHNKLTSAVHALSQRVDLTGSLRWN